MSLPAEARHRWGPNGGGGVAYLDLGDAIVVSPGGLDGLRSTLLESVREKTWRAGRDGFGDADLANE
ncbi:MAG: hypothetical protein DLM54_01300 [Acidimicrobiales bacterium]|nr:MAG: hypothetical protein DLM54_01300 [Acidimicrobiales bacterium]